LLDFDLFVLTSLMSIKIIEIPPFLSIQFGDIAHQIKNVFVGFERMPTYFPFSRYVIDLSIIVFGCKIYVDDSFFSYLWL